MGWEDVGLCQVDLHVKNHRVQGSVLIQSSSMTQGSVRTCADVQGSAGLRCFAQPIKSPLLFLSTLRKQPP